MAKWQDLQDVLESMFGSKNVYYQPPESLKMNYPAIRFSKTKIQSRFADDSAYSFSTSYQIIVIDKKPDNDVIEKLLKLPYCSYDNHYISDNLNHDVLTIYY